MDKLQRLKIEAEIRTLKNAAETHTDETIALACAQRAAVLAVTLQTDEKLSAPSTEKPLKKG